MILENASMNSGAAPLRAIGRYELLETLGEGGMGVVYKARDTRLGRLVALKVMRADKSGDAGRRRRFLREARAASALNHPGILTIYEIGEENGVDYIAMEYVDGGTLADLLDGGPLPAERALRLAAQVVDALSAAHAARIVHRDLKPSNLMVSADDRVKVVDFGLAKPVEPALSEETTTDALTAAGVAVGTLPYMSPEQAAGRPVDARSDLFSLGAILYEMLAGRRPFSGGSPAGLLSSILCEAPAPIPGAAPEVARLLERCLQKDAGRRFQSAGELKAALEGCLRPRAVPERPSVAVLPFANMSGAKEDDILCEGLAEEVINALTRIPGLLVIARTSAFAVARLGLDVREAGARLGVGAILEGSVRRAGNRVRIATQLVSANDGGHLWGERYDRELTDVLALEDEIATAIAGRLSGELVRGERRTPRSPVDAEAHAAYLEGRYHFARGTPDELAKAAACYQLAIARDPGYALAYDSLAELHWYLGFFGGVPPREAFSVSTWHALRAIELDDTLAEAHALLAMLRKELDYDWKEVDREIRRALELNAQSPLVRLRDAISGLIGQGRVEEGLAEVEGVLRNDPLSLLTRWWAGVFAMLCRRFERVLEEGHHMVALDSTHFVGHWLLGMGRDGLGAPEEAVEHLERAHQLSGGIPLTLGFLAYAYGRAGRREDALALLDQARRAAEKTYVPPSTFAFGAIGLGDWDSAFEWLGKAIEARDPLVVPIKTFAFLDPIRADPRYRALLSRMNLSP